MENWKHTIWRVPLISVITGFLWTPCMVRLLVHFAIVRQPDGSLDFNESRQLLIYGLGRPQSSFSAGCSSCGS